MEGADKPIVRIPSHLEVAQQSASKPPVSFFSASSSSSSFAETFSFVRNTEFYSPPPAPPPPPPVPASPSLHKEASPAVAPTAPLPQARNGILVSRRQQGNPILKYIRNVRWTFADIVPDYLLGQTSCALYLSIRYHLLHPDYLYFRIRELQKNYRLRVVLCHVDVEDVIKPLHEVTRTALLHDCSLLCGWSLEECARYLETIKIYENKPADNIQERTDNDYLSRLTSTLTTVRHVNKTDVHTLGSTFGTLASIIGGSMEELARCPGIGERKVKRLYDAFHEPFRRTSKQLRLSNVGIISSIDKQKEGDMGKALDREENPGQKHEVSIREALNQAYAKISNSDGAKISDSDGGSGTRQDGERTNLSSANKNTFDNGERTDLSSAHKNTLDN